MGDPRPHHRRHLRRGGAEAWRLSVGLARRRPLPRRPPGQPRRLHRPRARRRTRRLLQGRRNEAARRGSVRRRAHRARSPHARRRPRAPALSAVARRRHGNAAEAIAALTKVGLVCGSACARLLYHAPTVASHPPGSASFGHIRSKSPRSPSAFDAGRSPRSAAAASAAGPGTTRRKPSRHWYSASTAARSSISARDAQLRRHPPSSSRSEPRIENSHDGGFCPAAAAASPVLVLAALLTAALLLRASFLFSFCTRCLWRGAAVHRQSLAQLRRTGTCRGGAGARRRR